MRISKEHKELFILHLSGLDEDGSKAQAIEDAGYSDGLLSGSRTDDTTGVYEVVRSTSNRNATLRAIVKDFEGLGITITNTYMGDPPCEHDRSWKKRAAIAAVVLAALAGTFKLGYDSHRPKTKLEVQTRYETAPDPTTPSVICEYLQDPELDRTTKNLMLSGWMAIESSNGTDSSTDVLVPAAQDECPIEMAAWIVELDDALDE